MTRCLVLDVETRLDRMALAAAGRRTAPLDMPPALQVVTGVAMLEFDRDDAGSVSDLRLTSHDAEDGREADQVVAVDHELARLHACGGELITFNGVHDLGVLRLALLRGRNIGGGGVLRWLDEPADRHRDLMRDVARDGRWSRLTDLAASLGFAPPAVSRTVAEAGGERAKAETDVALTALLAVHLDAERHGDPRTLARALIVIGRFLAARNLSAPHLGDILKSRLFATASRTLAPGTR